MGYLDNVKAITDRIDTALVVAGPGTEVSVAFDAPSSAELSKLLKAMAELLDLYEAEEAAPEPRSLLKWLLRL